MKTITLRPAEPERDFAHLATWFSMLEDDALPEQGLKEYYEKRREKIIQRIAENEEGELQGFYLVNFTIIQLLSIDLLVSQNNEGKELANDCMRT